MFLGVRVQTGLTRDCAVRRNQTGSEAGSIDTEFTKRTGVTGSVFSGTFGVFIAFGRVERSRVNAIVQHADIRISRAIAITETGRNVANTVETSERLIACHITLARAAW